MTKLDVDDNYAVLINTFDVAPEDADALVTFLIKATEKIMRSQEGFVSANFHVSHDRTRVVNYAQWRTREAFEAMRSNPLAAEHMAGAAKLAKSFDPVLYDLRHTDSIV